VDDLFNADPYANRFLYTGREFLKEANLYDYRNRVYSAELGRFLQTDPIRFDAGDGNLYRYISNLVTIYRDPEGLKWTEVAGTEKLEGKWKRVSMIRWQIGPADSFGLGVVDTGFADYEAIVSVICKCGSETKRATGKRRVANRETNLSPDAQFVGKGLTGLSPVGPSGKSSFSPIGTIIAAIFSSNAAGKLPNPVVIIPPGSDPSQAILEVDANVPKRPEEGVWDGGSPCSKL
jgi:RHS repeat-associated protein